MIEYKNITKKFQTDFWEKPFLALDDVSFNIEEGKITGFLGANGAGKTTLLKILMKFIKSDNGEIKFSDSLGKNQNEIFSNIGYLPERPYFYPYLSGREFIYYMGKLGDLKKNMINEKLIYWSEKFQIGHALDRKVRTYSKGMLQRLGFVSVLIHSPKLLILDEPLSGLDPIGRKEIKDVICELGKDGKTVFFSSHIVSDVEEVCENVIVLEKGKLLYDGEINALVGKNKNEKIHIKGIRDKQNFSIEIAVQDKDDYIKDLITNDGTIHSLTKTQKTLEEIVYKIQG